MAAPHRPSKRAGATALPHAPGIGAGLPQPWPFSGRDLALSQLRAALSERGAVVAGPAGCGKTALVGASGVRITARFVATAAASALDLWGVRALLGDLPLEGDPVATLDAALRAQHRGAGLPVLLIDDIDHLDQSSAATVVRLVEQGRARLLATRRSTQAPPPAVAALWREAGVARIDLGPLSEDDVTEVLHRALGSGIDGRTVTEIGDLAAGNPLLLRELITASVASGVLAHERGLWRLNGPPVFTPEVADRAAEELAGADQAGRSALELLALAGPVPPELADVLVPAQVLEQLERAGLVGLAPAGSTPDPDAAGDQVAVASPVLAETLRRALPRTARKRLSLELARAAQQAGVAAPSLELRTVVWLLDAGQVLDAGRELAAARLAIEAGDPGLAEQLAARSSADRPTTEAALLESWCADERGDLARAEEILASHTPDGDEAAVAVAIRRAEQQFWGRRDPVAARAVLDAARVAATEPWTLATVAQQAVFDGLDGQPQVALDAALPLVAHRTHLAGSTAALAATFSLTAADRATEAKAVAEDALGRLAGPAPALFIDPGVHIIGLIFALHGAGELETADQLVSDVYRHTLGRTGLQAQGWAALLRAHVLAARGRPGRAADAALEAEFVWSSANLQGPARWSATVAALAHAEAGEVDELSACLDRALAYDGVPFRLFEPELLRAQAWLAHHHGRSDAVELFASAAALAASTGRWALAAGAAHDLVRVGEPEEAVGILSGLPTSSPVTDARRILAAAAAAGDGEGLLTASDAFAAFGAAGWAIEARALAARVLPAQAAALLPEVEAAAQDLGLATPPLCSQASAVPHQALTAREAEVVRLAASGMANRAIAQELVVSLRTVENHLHRAFAKLGVTSRADLPR